MNNRTQEERNKFAMSSNLDSLLNQMLGIKTQTITLLNKLKGRTMDTITKVSQLSFAQGQNSESAFTIKLTNSKFDSLAGSELLVKVESWVSANVMMNNKEVPVLIVDMENVEFIDSQGLQKLLACLRLMQSHKSNLLLCSQQPSVRLVFEITRIDQLFAVFPSVINFVNHFDAQNQGSEYLLAA
ncbi:MAG: STAS domain-containing protein [Pseudanabaena sp. Salubria-1]|nr:STAS domain-containing protein [Pseudanabaena sp. Salubria-1]